MTVERFVERFDDKPLSLLFEELCASKQGQFRDIERQIKKQIAKLLGDATPHPLHSAIADPFTKILTTNYDYSLEVDLVGPFYVRKPVLPETRYSLFRRVLCGEKEIWHVHGEISVPDSILLGYDQYAGYLQKIRNYLTGGLPHRKAELIRSPLKSGTVEFEEWGWEKYSWVDYFLRDHLHIVGLGLDFTEIDIWWLLLHKRRRLAQTGHTFYYYIKIRGEEAKREAPRLSVLRSLGMSVVPVEAADYEEGYWLIVKRIAENIAKHQGRRTAAIDVFPAEENGAERPGVMLETAEPLEPQQAALQFGRKRRRPTRKSS